MSKGNAGQGGRRVGSRYGLRTRSTIAVLAAAVTVLSIFSAILFREARDLERAYTAFEVSEAAIIIQSKLVAGDDPTPIMADAPPYSLVLVAEGENVVFSFGESTLIDAIVKVPIEEGRARLVDINGRSMVLYDAPCRLWTGNLKCQFRVATPETPLRDFLAEEWPDVASIIVPILALTALAIPLLVGRSLRIIGELAAEVDSISTPNELHQLPRPLADDEILHLTDTLNGLLARLHDSYVAQHRFIADASHELRSPVAAIGVTTDVANRFPERRGQDATWERLTAEAGRLRRTVDQLLVLAAIEHPVESETVLEPVDLAAIARSQVSLDPSVELDVVQQGLPFALTTIASAEMIMSNLVTNAVRHARTQAHIRIESDGSGWIRLEVTDDGDGIALSDHERVFDAFTRLDAARSREAGGSGLGLAIARAAARSSGGELVIDADRHSTFVCTFKQPPAVEGDR